MLCDGMGAAGGRVRWLCPQCEVMNLNLVVTAGDHLNVPPASTIKEMINLAAENKAKTECLVVLVCTNCHTVYQLLWARPDAPPAAPELEEGWQDRLDMEPLDLDAGPEDDQAAS